MPTHYHSNMRKFQMKNQCTNFTQFIIIIPLKNSDWYNRMMLYDMEIMHKEQQQTRLKSVYGRSLHCCTTWKKKGLVLLYPGDKYKQKI